MAVRRDAKRSVTATAAMTAARVGEDQHDGCDDRNRQNHAEDDPAVVGQVLHHFHLHSLMRASLTATRSPTPIFPAWCESPPLDEVARRPDATRQVFTNKLMGVIENIASRLDPTQASELRIGGCRRDCRS